ncbi:MAG: response regulator [Candidatus Cloacimonadota bacterium]
MNQKILVVDDEQGIRDIICEFLTEAGYQVQTAVDGLDALEKMAFESFDLYILDVYMPRMNGLELLIKIKEIQPLAVIIVSTGFSNTEVAIKAIRSGAYHYFTKPIQADDLLKVVESGIAHAFSLGESTANAEAVPDTYDHQLLRGFSSDQIHEFSSIGTLSSYKRGEKLHQDDSAGCMILVESGKVAVIYNGCPLDVLGPGKIWGEEVFINPGAMFTDLIVQEDAQIRHFNRKKLIEFFTYQDETLTKKYMINLILCIYSKWRRSVYKLGLFSGYNPLSQKKET